MSRPDVLIAGRYRLVERIAAGGMGSVWEAWDERLHRRVALKELHPQPGLSPADARLAGDRAMREARITARLHHAHAVPVYDVVDHEGQPCLIMQYLPSKSLQSVLSERGVLSVAEVARIGSELAGALAAAHRAGIVHRDVKPGNVLIDDEGAAKLTDFGISHALGDVTLTSTGMVTGTPAFLAPEVARGVESGFAADVFSLGSTLYAALEGTPPFGTGENPMATLHRVASGQIVPPQRSGPLTGELRRMLATDPTQRPSMDQVASSLTAVRSERPDPAAGVMTERLAMPGPSGPPPPTRTQTLPAVRPGPAMAPGPGFGPPSGPPGPPGPAGPSRPPGPSGSRSRKGALLGLLALVAVAALVTLLVTQLGNSGGRGNAGAAGSQQHTTSAQRNTSTKATTSANTASASTSASTSQSSPTSSSGTSGGPASASELTAALKDYYKLLPDNTDAGWSRLTPSYQSNTANGRQDYETFWGSMKKVSVSQATGRPPGTVEATVNYDYQDGRKVEERTSFTFVRQDGILKIDDSTVLSSTTK
ncbi:MAG: eukaryotic-like serine/threonine-protein kinase [Pseudonocardiales bacterium]|nr:eukaryotic-like serine/threonine-protein kinase [Pseudonocardiales bacterium]MDT4947473.1 eukaryotic-like serine/threonine-protein kinase [Pseudonocardiales bacterium]